MKVNKNITFDYQLYEIVTGNMLNSVLDDEGNIIMRLFQCKDYIQDLYWAEYFKKDIIKYGLRYDGVNLNNLLNKGTIKLLVTSKDGIDYKPVIDNIIRALNLVESRFDIEKSTYEVSETDDKDVVIFFNEGWFKMPYMISLFMLLVKTTKDFTGDTIESLIEYFTKNDTKLLGNNYSQQIMFFNKHNILQQLIIDLEFPEDNWENYKTVDDCHDDCGLMAFFSRRIDKEETLQSIDI